MADGDANVQRTLGELLAEVKNLGKSIHDVKEEMRRSEDKSTESRRGMHQRMDLLVEQVGDLEVSVSKAQKDIADMKPVTDDVKRWKLMGIGALGVVGIGGTALGVILAGMLENAARLLRGG